MTLNDAVHKCMSNGRWWTFWELSDVIKNNTGTYYGDPTISAAIRNMRKLECRKKYGLSLHGEVIEKKRITDGKGYRYRLITE